MTQLPQQDPHAWRLEYIEMMPLSKYQLDLLERGPQSLSQSWYVGAMYNDWKRKKGIRDPEPPDCQSSLQEFYKKQEDIEHGS